MSPRPRASLCSALACAVIALGSPSGARQATPGGYDPEAIRLLQQMADTYAHLTALKQDTEFASVITPLAPVATPPAAAPPRDGAVPPAIGSEKKLDKMLHLSYAAPNRLRLDVEDRDDDGKIAVSTWASDGKSFWTYNPEKNLFSREKAPGRLHDFAKLPHMTSGSLEVLMLMGVNPFAGVEEQTESVRSQGRETVRGVATDVVSMRADLGGAATETRLYIGAEDHLLYRVVSETVPKVKPPRRPLAAGSPLDELAPPEAPSSRPLPGEPDDVPSLPGIPMKSIVTYDNTTDIQPKFDFNAFAYTPPATALYLTNPAQEKPMTLKQRLAELSKAVRKKKQPAPRVYRY
ncbi:MAG TPA: DUF2092 domain-containing protein [Chthonomonadaceae bacterium]|nr:DUF2092 domain-containing protein [Chthonomonadaceae bacterium]